MYSNWLWHRPLQLLVDAGEGLQLALSANVFSPSCVAITHGHSDHVLGLPGLIGARRFGKGAPTNPLAVVYPDASRGVAAVRDLLADDLRRRSLPRLLDSCDGRQVSLIQSAKARSLEAFAVRHTADERGPAATGWSRHAAGCAASLRICRSPT